MNRLTGTYNNAYRTNMKLLYKKVIPLKKFAASTVTFIL